MLFENLETKQKKFCFHMHTRALSSENHSEGLVGVQLKTELLRVRQEVVPAWSHKPSTFVRFGYPRPNNVPSKLSR
jgi:hypothetical protein